MKSNTRYARKLNRKRVLICLLIFFALLPVFSYLHEAGHALVCIADGNEAEISVDIFSGGTTLCHGDVSNLFAYKISGGLLAGIIGTTIGIALFRWKIPFIAITTIGVGHLVNAGIETFADSYFTHGVEWSFFLGLVEFVTFFILLLIFDRKPLAEKADQERTCGGMK
jgi:ABC-type branched-subunit amino acid transport system permease subunit